MFFYEADFTFVMVHLHSHSHAIHLFSFVNNINSPWETNERRTCPPATGDTIHSFTLGVCWETVLCLPRLCVWSCSLSALPYGRCVRTLQDFFFFLESHPVVLTLSSQTWPAHAGPRWGGSEPPSDGKRERQSIKGTF